MKIRPPSSTPLSYRLVRKPGARHIYTYTALYLRAGLARDLVMHGSTVPDCAVPHRSLARFHLSVGSSFSSKTSHHEGKQRLIFTVSKPLGSESLRCCAWEWNFCSFAQEPSTRHRKFWAG